jgi:hypothetical protein
MSKKPRKDTKTKATQLNHSAKTIEYFTPETKDKVVISEFQSIEDELKRTEKEQHVKTLYLMSKLDIWLIKTDVEERESNWSLSPHVSYRILKPRLTYLKDKFDWERRKEAVASEEKCKFINPKNIQHPNMVIKVETISYLLVKNEEPEERDGFLGEPSFRPHVFKKEDCPKLFKGESGSYSLVECTFPTRITLGYMEDGKFRKETMSYKILLISKAKKAEYLKDWYKEMECLRRSSTSFTFLLSGLFNHVFPRLCDIIEVFEQEKNIAKPNIEFLNEIKCFCEFKVDAVSMFLVSIIESVVNLLLTQKLLSICEYCGDVFSYKRGKKYCSLLEEGKNCGEKARNKKDYERHKDSRRKYYAQEMKETRNFLKERKGRHF